MADNTNIWPIFRWANWWLSDDLFTGIQNSFYYSKNIEIREDMRSIYPCPQSKVATASSTVTSTPVKMLQITDTIRAVFSSDKVYTFNSENESISEAHDFDIRVCDACVFGNKIFVSTRTKLYQYNYENPDWSNPVEICSLTDNTYHPLLPTSTTLVIGDKNIIKVILYNALNTAIDQITLASNCLVKLLDFLWWYTRIVIEKDYYRNEIWLWDNSKEAINERIPMDWYKFYQSVVYKGQHYLVSNKWLGMMNWYNYFIIKRFDKFSDNINSICVYDDKIYIGWTDWIYIYWAKNKNYSEVLAMWTYTWAKVGALASNYQDIFTSTGTKIWFNTNAATDWEIQTMAYYWNSLSQIKQCLYMRLWYKITDGWFIKAYYRTDKVNSRTEFTMDWWLTSQSNMRSPFATSIKLNLRFQWIQFKFVLSWEDTHLYSADLFYNWMLD